MNRSVLLARIHFHLHRETLRCMLFVLMIISYFPRYYPNIRQVNVNEDFTDISQLLTFLERKYRRDLIDYSLVSKTKNILMSQSLGVQTVKPPSTKSSMLIAKSCFTV